MPKVHDWRSTYRRHAQLEKTWTVDGAPEPVARQFLRRIVHGHQSRAAILREFASFGLKPPTERLLGEAFALQAILYPAHDDRPQGRHPDDPLEDVYAAALSMLPHGFWVTSPDRAQLYRGQRNASWPAIPSLFRTVDVDGALRRLESAVPRIRRCLPEASDEKAVAVAQHYSAELGVATWLLDMTYDPRVALYFASDRGLAGEIGVVMCVVRKEWEKLSASGTNRLGLLRVIDAPGVKRIEQQRASFLDTSHPDLFEQYVAHSVWFRQVDGLRFEDPDAPFPVTSDSIYPQQDPLARALLSDADHGAATLSIAPAGDARAPLGSRDYVDIARSWCREAGVPIDAYHEEALYVACDIHARLQRRRGEFGLPERSLARLGDAVGLVMQAQVAGEPITPAEAMRWSLSRLPPARQAKLRAIIAEASAARDLC